MRTRSVVVAMLAASVIWGGAALGQTRPVGQDAAAAGAAQVLCLDSNQPVKVRPRQSLLVRELVRQAVLIAAREELGLPTRDAALREPFPAGARVLDVEVAALGSAQYRWTLVERNGGAGESKVLWQRTLKVHPYKDLLPTLVTESGPTLYAELTKALKDSGYAAATVPAAGVGGA